MKPRLLIALLALCALASPLHAATGIAPRWSKIYGGTSPTAAGTAQYFARSKPQSGGDVGGDDQVAVVAFDAGGNLFVADQSLPNAASSNTTLSTHIIKLTAMEGGLLWDQTVTAGVAITSMVVDVHGDVVASGLANGSSTSAYVAKFSGIDGSLVWQMTGNAGATMVLLALDPTGNVFISTDGTFGTATGSTPPPASLRTVKLASADGSGMWTQTTLGTVAANVGNVLLSDSQGNAVLALESSGQTQVTKLAAADGSVKWNRVETGTALGVEIQVEPNDDVVLVANAANPNSAAQPTGYVRTTRYAVADGTTVWEQLLPGTTEQVPIGIRIDVNGSVFMLASANKGAVIEKYAGNDGHPFWNQLLTDGGVSGLALTSAGDLAVGGAITNPASLYLALLATRDGTLESEHHFVTPGFNTTSGGKGRRLVAGGANSTIGLVGEATTDATHHDLGIVLYQPSTTVPTVTLNGDATVVLPDGTTTYTDAGATAMDSTGTMLTPTLLPNQPLTTTSIFPLPQPGFYRVNYTAIDATGLIGGASRTVQELDTTPPALTVKNVTLEATNNGGTNVTSYPVTFTDNDANVTLTYDVPLPHFFPLGTATVNVTATDSSGNSSMASFTVTVQDTKAPVIDPDEVDIFATNSMGAQVQTYPITITDADNNLTTTFNPPAPIFLPLGTTQVMVTAKDSTGNSSQATINVVVSLRPAPTISSSDITVEATSSAGAIISAYQATLTSTDPAATLTYDTPPPHTFPIGTTVVTATATDSEGQVAMKSFNVIVQDTTPPQITLLRSVPVPPGPLADYRSLILVTDFSPVTVTQSPAIGTTVNPGPLVLTFTATDSHGNSSTAMLPVTVGLLTSAGVHKTDPVPQAGGTPGVPSNARFVSFGVPAIDDLENLAYTGVWEKGARRGTSLVMGQQCVATIGQAVPGLPATTYSIFDAPVIADGNLAFIAHLAGRSAGSAVLVQPAGGLLGVLARTGTAAPGLTAEKFSSFRTVAVAGDAIAFEGHAVDRTGRPVMGIWMTDGTHPLQLIVNEGVTIDGHKIKTLAPINPGAGSPGQGRGWLLETGGVPTIRALALCTDGSQLFFSGGFDAAPTALLTAQATANLKSFGLPAFNAQGEAVSLATRSTLAGDPPPKSQSLFSFDGAGQDLAPLVTVAGDSDSAVVRALKDPILAAGDNGLAVIATLKPTLGAARATLLWAPPGEPLAELAHIGGELVDFPTATWQTFKSLGLSTGHGPILIATLGGAGKNKEGLWATTSLGDFQRLFLVGDVVDNQTLRSFTLLTATPGSAGVTRSFNSQGEIAFRAVFTNGNEELIITKVP